jgi:hypothetical protein
MGKVRPELSSSLLPEILIGLLVNGLIPRETSRRSLM